MIKNKKLKLLVDFIGMTLGAVIAAFAIEEFLVPCTILDGGVVGVGIMISTLSKIPLSMLTICLNLPFLIFGARKLGKMFIVKSAYSMAVFSIFLDVFAPMANATEEYLLAVCFGGVILGIGVGLVIKFGGCLDGTETAAILLNKKMHFSVGNFVLICNIIIFAVAGIVLKSFDRAMYSLLTYFITSKVLDIVESGMEQTKAAMIITNDAKEISEKIYTRLGRTVTIMEGEGLVSGKKVVLYCVLTRFEIHELIAVSDVSEIIGNHVKKSGTLPKEPQSDKEETKKDETVQT